MKGATTPLHRNGTSLPYNGGFSWAVQILPYAEEVETFDKIASLSTVNGEAFGSYEKFIDCLYQMDFSGLNGDGVFDSVGSSPVHSTVIPWAVCPARNTGGVNDKRGNSTYRANGGTKTWNGHAANRFTLRPEDGPMKHASAT